MILPNKYIREEDALIGIGASILKLMTKDLALSELWEESKSELNLENFERFIFTLDMLFLMGLIEFNDNKLRKVAR